MYPWVPPLVELTEAERQHLGVLAQRTTGSVREAARARIVLLAAEGCDDKEIQRRVGCTVATIRVWRRRFVAGRLAAIPDRPKACGW